MTAAGPAYVVSAIHAIFDAVRAGGAIAPRCNSSFLLYMIADLYAKRGVSSPGLSWRGCGGSAHCAVACFSGCWRVGVLLSNAMDLNAAGTKLHRAGCEAGSARVPAGEVVRLI